jgi:uncharacterized membrane protein
MTPPDTLAAPAPDVVERTLVSANDWLGRRWLAIVTLAAGLFVALPLSAPFLAQAGHTTAAGTIYGVYRVTCHQLPQRSWFVGGPKPAYSWSEVQAYTQRPDASPLLAFHNPLGNPALGYQLGFCQRDTAIYLSVFLTCLAYGLWRRRRQTTPMPFRWYLLFAVPMAIDGVSQLIGLRESTPLLRTVTGALFGVGSAWLVLTYLDATFRESAAYAAGRGAGSAALGSGS